MDEDMSPSFSCDVTLGFCEVGLWEVDGTVLGLIGDVLVSWRLIRRD